MYAFELTPKYPKKYVTPEIAYFLKYLIQIMIYIHFLNPFHKEYCPFVTETIKFNCVWNKCYH